MADGNKDDFSADIEELERGGVHLQDISTLAATIRANVHNVTGKYGRTLGGNGDIGKSFEVNYYPAADAGLQFLDALADLVDTHGSKTIKLGGFFADVNDTSTTESNSTPHRH